MNQKFLDTHEQVKAWLRNDEARAFKRLLKQYKLSTTEFIRLAVAALVRGDFDSDMAKFK